jgi:hypothetical protein
MSETVGDPRSDLHRLNSDTAPAPTLRELYYQLIAAAHKAGQEEVRQSGYKARADELYAEARAKLEAAFAMEGAAEPRERDAEVARLRDTLATVEEDAALRLSRLDRALDALIGSVCFGGDGAKYDTAIAEGRAAREYANRAAAARGAPAPEGEKP